MLASTATGRRILSPGEQRLRDVGQRLFEALFSGPVYDAYRATAAAADERGERLRVVLQLDVPELAAIPWEAMYDPANDEFICRAANRLIRHIPSATPAPLAVTASLEVLVLVASPDGLTVLDVEAERKKLSDALAAPIADGRIRLKWLMQATWEQVQDEMLSGTWHVLHFIGHGDYDPQSDQGVIVLVGDAGGPHLVPADRLADLLNQATPTPRLVVLNSCQSGRSGARDLFSSTAATLVRRGISAVAAMQFAVSDAGAIKFADAFYSALATGHNVGDAIASGRVGLLGTPGSLEWVTPVLYVRGDAATLFRITSEPGPPVPSPPTEPAPRRLSRARLAVLGGVAAAVVAGVAILLVPKGSPPPGPSPSPATVASAPAAVPVPDDADGIIRALSDVGVDFSIPRAAVVEYLHNPQYAAYPAVATALLQLLGDRGLRQPVFLDVIVANYELSPGHPSPRRPQDVDAEVLRSAVVQGFNERYGQHLDDFEALLTPPG